MDRTNLRKLANSYDMFDGNATIWLNPIVTLRHHMAVDNAKGLFPATDDDEWYGSLNPSQKIFYLIEGNIVDLECREVAEDHEHFNNVTGLQVYYESRNGNFVDNWEYFTTCVTWDVVLELFKAYNETRRVIPQIESEILADGPPDIKTDPKETGSGRKRTKKKSATI